MSISLLRTQPSSKELVNRLRLARELLAPPCRRIVIIDQLKWDEEWERLAKVLRLRTQDLELSGSRFELAAQLLEDVTPHDHC